MLIVSSEVASAGLNWEGSHDGFLFGDGAVAVVLQKTPEHRTSKILASQLETYSQWADLTQIKGGGTRLYGTKHTAENHEKFMYHMDGPGILRCPFVFSLISLSEHWKNAACRWMISIL